LETCAPELLELGLHDAGADVWAFGCVVYWLAAGEYPLGRVYNSIQRIQQFDEVRELGPLKLPPNRCD